MPATWNGRAHYIAAAMIALVTCGATGREASAQGTLEARYVASIAGLPIGKGFWLIDISSHQFVASASGRTIGLMQIFAGGHGSAASRGSIDGGRLANSNFASTVVTDDRDDEIRIAIQSGNVKSFSAKPPLVPAPDRVPVTEAHRHGVLDPMAAALVPVAGDGDLLSPKACNRKLPVFDGRGRFDLALSFKRMDQVKADKGYQGPVVVCGVRFQPISGHRPDRAAVKYLVAATDIEMWLAPVKGTRFLVPFKISVPTVIGPAVLQADKFVTNAQVMRPTPTMLKTQ